MYLSRRLRRTTAIASEPLHAAEFGSPISSNLFFAQCNDQPTIGFRVRARDGREYQINLTAGDIEAINRARNVDYAGDEYGWPTPICRDGICRAPIACKAFGYCRKLNME